MQQLQRIGLSVGLVLGTVGGGFAAAQGDSAAVTGANGTEGVAEAPAPAPVDATRTAALLGRLHRAAARQSQLGDLAEGAATRPETRVYGAELKSQFGALDDRVRAFAAANGISQEDLDRVAPGENVVAMQRHVDDLAKLANTHGAAFDRDFWVAVATEQAATSDLLAATLEQDPALAGIVADFSGLLDKTSRRASVAAEASVPVTPPATTPGPESQPPSDEDAH